MVDTPNEDSINTTDRRDATMEGDNNSDTTEVMGANSTFQAPKMTEKCIKFVFRVNNNEEASTVAQGHFQILKAINDAFGSEVIITDNANEQVTTFKLTGFPEYQRKFKIHHRQGNDKQQRKRKPSYTVIHRIYTSISLTTIRKQAQVSQYLRMYKGSMMYHPWTEDVTDIVSLGFLVNIDPVNHPKEFVEEKIKAKFKKEAKCADHQIPTFKVVMSSPSHTQDDQRLWTKSYDLQVERKNAKPMIRIIKQAYAVSKDFIFYRMRHEVPATFKAAIKAQNQFLNQARIVPIQGIPKDMMWAMEPELLALTGVKEVLPHWKTTAEGRWNLLTHTKAFPGVIKYLDENISLLYDKYLPQCQHTPQRNEYPPATVCTKSPHSLDYDSDSDKSYFSNCSDAYSLFHDDVSESDPPVANKPSIQAWGKPAPRQIHVSDVTTVASTKVSDLSNPLVESELERLRAENRVLHESITELKTQFALMQHKDSHPNLAQAPTPTPEPQPPPQVNSELADVHARLNSFEDQLQQFLDRAEKSANPTTPPRIAGAKRQNTSDTPPLFKGTSTEVALL
jgi:hypothetical protein